MKKERKMRDLRLGLEENAQSEKIVILTEREYCHVINKRTGNIKLVEGPERLRFLPFSPKSLYGQKMRKIILQEGQYALILNPFDVKTKSLSYGDREVRVGPCIFSLYHGEKLDISIPVGTIQNRAGIKDIYVLERDRGLVVKALKDFSDGDFERKAGEEWIVRGPIHYIPHKYVKVRRLIREISLAEHSGIYIKNTKTGKIRLEKGAKNITVWQKWSPHAMHSVSASAGPKTTRK